MNSADTHERRLRAVAERDGWIDVWGNLDGLVARLGWASTRLTEELFMAIIDAMEAAYDAGCPGSTLRSRLVQTQSALIMAMRYPAKVGDVVRVAHAFAFYKPHVCAWRYIGDDLWPRTPYASGESGLDAETEARAIAAALDRAEEPVIRVAKLRSGRWRVAIPADDREIKGHGDTPELAWRDAAKLVRAYAEDALMRLDKFASERDRLLAALSAIGLRAQTSTAAIQGPNSAPERS